MYRRARYLPAMLTLLLPKSNCRVCIMSQFLSHPFTVPLRPISYHLISSRALSSFGGGWGGGYRETAPGMTTLQMRQMRCSPEISESFPPVHPSIECVACQASHAVEGTIYSIMPSTCTYSAMAGTLSTWPCRHVLAVLCCSLFQL